MDIKYYVRTTKEREFNYSPLKYTSLVDPNHRPVKSFIAQLEYIADDNAVLLEDDLILCDNFQEKIEDVIAQYPNKVINFFYSPDNYFTTHETDSFCWNQCTYYPKGIAAIIAQKMREIIEQKGKTISYDTLENLALKELNISHIVYRPCLVQHIGYNSLISINSWKDTIYFEDYLKELNISYQDAFSKDNQEKLKKLRDKTRQTIKTS